MKTLSVYYAGWGENWLLGQLADNGHTLLFEYSAEALQQGLELSPLNLPLRPQAYSQFPLSQHRLPGLLADSLPDGWGLLLMDRVFRQQGIRHPSPLDRLAFIGQRAMGALHFKPETTLNVMEPDWDLMQLAHESERVLQSDATEALQQLAVAGGSPQGARPKALIQYDRLSNRVSTHSHAAGSPWLVKFPAQHEHKEVCAIEQLYADMARRCDIEIPDSLCFDLSPTLAAFAVARFDRSNGQRVPTHSMAGLLDVDFRMPGSADYTSFLRATRLITRDVREVHKAYARAVFNVVFHNRDDHPKNVAWRLDAQRHWKLAPAFDLTFSEGPYGQHHMDICGQGDAISRKHLLQLASDGGLSEKSAARTIDFIATQADLFIELAKDYAIRKTTVQHIQQRIEQSRKLLRE